MKILYLPILIDVPKFDNSKIVSYAIKSGRYQPYWKTLDITTLELPELNYLKEQLPFDKITNIYFKEQTTYAKPHYDVYSDMRFESGEYEHILNNEPAGYRIVLEGKSDSLYVKSRGDFRLAHLPNVPGCYVLNSTEGLHLVKNDPGRKILYIRGFLNKEKHESIIKQNYEKFKEFALLQEIDENN